MRRMLIVRDALGRFYGKYDTAIRILLKFALAFASFAAINAALDQPTTADHPLILPALATACAFLPSNAVLIVGAGLILIDFYAVSLEALIIGGGILMIAMLFYFSLAPHSAWPLVLTALALGMDLGCVPALVFGLIGGPLAVMGISFGTLVYYLIHIVKDIGGSLQSVSTEAAEAMVQRMAELIRAVITHTEMLVMIVALSAVLLIVYFVRTLAVKYAWMLAAAAGCLTYLIIRVSAFLMMDMDLQAVSLALETAAALFAAWAAQTMLFSLDYKKTETVRFEDDEYYYYVKAVPKRKIHRKKRRRRAEER